MPDAPSTTPDPTPDPHPSRSPRQGHRVRNIVGVPVSGSDFFGRDRERTRIWERLEHNHVLLPSPRRVGKTSIMRQLAAEASEHGYHAAIYLDVAGASDEREFVAKLLTALAECPAGAPVLRRLRRGPFARMFARISSVSVRAIGVGIRAEPSKTWKQLGDECFSAIRTEGRGRWLLLCDELGILVQTLLRTDNSHPPGTSQRARTFLTWLRDDVRQRAPTAATDAEIRWVVASSIGLPTLTDLNRIGDTINDFELVPVGAFSDSVADRFLVELARGRDIELPAATRAKILEKVGWPVPYFLQVFFAALVEGGQQCPTVTDVEAAFERLLGIDYRAYFDWWSQRLIEELGRHYAHYARIALTQCAQSRDGVRRDTLVALTVDAVADPLHRDWVETRLFDTLESDGYWICDGERYRFRSNLLREYWLRRHGR